MVLTEHKCVRYMFVFNVIDVIGCFLNKFDILKLLLIITYEIQINSVFKQTETELSLQFTRLPGLEV